MHKIRRIKRNYFWSLRGENEKTMKRYAIFHTDLQYQFDTNGIHILSICLLTHRPFRIYTFNVLVRYILSSPSGGLLLTFH